MLRRMIATLLAAALTLALAGAVLAEEAAGTGLRLTARTIQPVTQAGQVATIEVSARNEGTATLEYWLPTPCHSPFDVSVTIGSRVLPMSREQYLDKEPLACIQVVKVLNVAPGQTLTERFAIRTTDVEPGTYTISVRFAGRGETGPAPAGINLPLTIGAGAMPDVTGHWSAPMVAEGLRAGFISGYPDGRFRPDSQVTRAEFIKMVVTARSLMKLNLSEPAFADAATHWVSTLGFLDAAIEARVVVPAEYADKLQPDAQLTRREAAMMVVRALGLESQSKAVSAETLPFVDKGEIPDWAAGHIMSASAAGIVKGYEDMTFRHDRLVTRAEAVAMVVRMVTAGATRVEATAAVEFNGRALPGAAVAVMDHSGRGLVSLSELGAAGITVTSGANGWYALSRSGQEIRVKAGVPFGLKPGEVIPLDVAVPVAIDGRLFVPAGVLMSLGLRANWDFGSQRFIIQNP